MAEINEYGYDKIRDYIKTSWQYIELQDETGNPVIRRQAEIIEHDEGNNIIKLQLIVSGSDVGASESSPVTVAKIAIYDVESNGDAIANKDFESADITTLVQSVDSLTVVHEIHVPEIA